MVSERLCVVPPLSDHFHEVSCSPGVQVTQAVGQGLVPGFTSLFNSQLLDFLLMTKEQPQAPIPLLMLVFVLLQFPHLDAQQVGFPKHKPSGLPGRSRAGVGSLSS